jgi:hypothetical protein
MFLGVECGQCIGLTTLQPSVSRLSRQCGILNISQSYRPPRYVARIALYLLLLTMFVPQWLWEMKAGNRDHGRKQSTNRHVVDAEDVLS